MTAGKKKSKAASPFSIVYIGFWCAIGAAALSYVGLTATSPLKQASAAAQTADLEQSVTELQKAASRTAAEVSTARKDIAAMRTDVEAIRAQTTAQADRDRQVLARVAAVEERITVAPAKAVEPPAPLPPAATTSPRAADPKLDPRRLKPRVSELTTGTVPAQPPAADARLVTEVVTPRPAPLGQRPAPPARPVKPILTVAAPVTTEPPIALTPPAVRQQQAARTYGLRLASGNTLDELRLSWSAINESNRDVLGPLQARYQKGAGDSPYQLIAGPFKTEAEAGRACLNLAAKGLACAPTAFQGQGL